MKAKYGEDVTVGLEELVQTDWQSSECSDSGEVAEQEWLEFRKSHGGDPNGLEIRRKVWRSTQVISIFCLHITIYAEHTLHKSLIAFIMR